MSLSLIIVATVFVTSLISGVIGMAGGMILMAVLVSLLSVPAAMVVHGAYRPPPMAHGPIFCASTFAGLCYRAT